MGWRRGLVLALGSLALVVVGFAGWKPGDAQGNEDGPGESGEGFRTLAVGGQSGFEGAGRFIVTNETEWDLLWSRHTSREIPPSPRPLVDFGRERVVAVFIGEKPDPCWSVRVTNFTTDLEAGVTFVNVTLHEPPPETICITVIAHPHHVVAIPQEDTDVLFRETKVVGEPPPPPPVERVPPEPFTTPRPTVAPPDT